MNPLHRLTIILATMSLGASVAAQAGDIVARVGERVTVHLHTGKLPTPLAERLADEALTHAESALPIVDKLLGSRDNAMLTLHVHAHEKTFRDAAQEHAPRRFLREDFSLPQSSQAFVLLWPQLPEATLELVGLPSPTADGLVRHTAQLIAAQRHPAAAKDPWLAELFGFGALEILRNPKAAADVDLAWDTRRFDAAWRLRKGRAQSLRTWLHDDAPTTRDDYDDVQGQQAILAQLLNDKTGSWAKKLFAKKPKDDAEPRSIRAAALEGVLGSDWAKTETRLTRLLREQDPKHLVALPMVLRDGTRIVFAGTKSHAAILQDQRNVPTGPFAVSLRLVATGECDFRVHFPWQQEDVLGAFLTAGQASFEIWDAKSNQWRTEHKERCAIEAGKPFDIRLEVRGELQLFIDDELVLRMPATNLDNDRTLSFACNFGVATLENLRIEALPVEKK